MTLLLLACSGGSNESPGPTATAAPTPTTTQGGLVIPTPTPNPTESVLIFLDALRAAGLPVGDYIQYDERTDPNALLGRPGGYLAKINFHDQRVKDKDTLNNYDMDGGGTVEIFASERDAKARFDYISPLSTTPLFGQYVYYRGKVVLRVSHHLIPSEAAEYNNVLSAMQ